MGTTKTTTNTQTTPTPEESQMEKIQLAQYKQLEPAQTALQQQALGLGSQLMGSFGNQDSSMWQSLIGGVTPQQQQSMISEQQRYLNHNRENIEIKTLIIKNYE